MYLNLQALCLFVTCFIHALLWPADTRTFISQMFPPKWFNCTTWLLSLARFNFVKWTFSSRNLNSSAGKGDTGEGERWSSACAQLTVFIGLEAVIHPSAMEIMSAPLQVFLLLRCQEKHDPNRFHLGGRTLHYLCIQVETNCKWGPVRTGHWTLKKQTAGTGAHRRHQEVSNREVSNQDGERCVHKEEEEKFLSPLEHGQISLFSVTRYTKNFNLIFTAVNLVTPVFCCVFSALPFLQARQRQDNGASAAPAGLAPSLPLWGLSDQSAVARDLGAAALWSRFCTYCYCVVSFFSSCTRAGEAFILCSCLFFSAWSVLALWTYN